MSSRLTMFVALLMSLLPATMAFGQQVLSSTELRELLVGKRAIFAYGVMALAPNGSVVFTWNNGRIERGKYSISSNGICRTYESNATRCDRVGKDNQGLMLLDATNTKVRFSIGADEPRADAPQPGSAQNQPLPDQHAAEGTRLEIAEAVRAYFQRNNMLSSLKFKGTIIASIYALQSYEDECCGGTAVLKYGPSKGWQVIVTGGGVPGASNLIT